MAAVAVSGLAVRLALVARVTWGRRAYVLGFELCGVAVGAVLGVVLRWNERRVLARGRVDAPEA